MRLSVITITCRSLPRFKEMASSLVASFKRAPADTEVEWIIVDDKLWRMDPVERLGAVTEILDRQNPDTRLRFTVQHVPPPVTAHRGPDVGDPRPAHNTAKNHGLSLVHPDSIYAVFLSDCTVVTADWITVMRAMADQQVGWRCMGKAIHDHKIPDDEGFRYQDRHDSMHTVIATAVAGPCWGAPLTSFRAIGGFDIDYDGEDNFHDHEACLRLGRLPLPFYTTARAIALRLNRTQTKPDVTTRSDALRAARNQGYYTVLQQDRRRIAIPPGAAAVGRDPMAIARGGVAVHAPAPAVVAPPRVVAPPVRQVARTTAAPAAPPPAPRPAVFAAPARPVRQPAPAVPAPAAPAVDGFAVAGLTGPQDEPVDLGFDALHADEACGHQAHPDETPCKLKKSHPGPHVLGTPAWMFGWPAERVRARWAELEELQANPPAVTESGVPSPADVARELDDLWWGMGPEERDAIDPDGAAERAAEHAARSAAAAAASPTPAATPSTAGMTLHQRALAAQTARKAAAVAAAAGTAPPPEPQERCRHVPRQGVYAGLQCKKKVHGSAIPHAYDVPAPVSAAAAKPAAPSGPAVPRDPPEPPAAIATYRSRIDQMAAELAAHLAQRLPNNVGRQVVTLAVILRREGFRITSEAELVQMIAEAVPLVPGKPPEPRLALRAQALEDARAIFRTVPAIPGSPADFAALGRFAAEADAWRVASGFPSWAAMSPFERAYQVAGDLGIDVVSPDDFGDGDVDEVDEHERAAVAGGDVPMISTEPLTDEEAAQEQAAADALLAAEAARSLEPQPN